MSTRPEATESQSVPVSDQQSLEELFDPAAYFDQWLADLEATFKQLTAKTQKPVKESLQEEPKEELKHFSASA